ncbi:DUF983 domain-containing protein [Ktedonosporobacter rubrisoli]|uniref:DUF983 domain-containing protein n=1 Tax=Ktedonosporobacter rubrisoli TaxID=2509675 RepID=A0A4P6K0Z2_KTERU|nr:DUF983 domain-containing protein [Ktedonosporobacter rubrisoli]QBD81645.1 DUF983 domain-containing protein [Ktedonosporobacter rubrisoli]
MDFLTLLARGLTLHCPICGKGKLFRSPFKMYERCPNCGLVYEREEGYFTSSMAINLVISELLIACFVVPLAANPNIPAIQLVIWGSPAPILLPLIFFHHSRGLWLSMDYYLHPRQRI